MDDTNQRYGGFASAHAADTGSMDGLTYQRVGDVDATRSDQVFQRDRKFVQRTLVMDKDPIAPVFHAADLKAAAQFAALQESYNDAFATAGSPQFSLGRSDKIQVGATEVDMTRARRLEALRAQKLNWSTTALNDAAVPTQPVNPAFQMKMADNSRQQAEDAEPRDTPPATIRLPAELEARIRKREEAQAKQKETIARARENDKSVRTIMEALWSIADGTAKSGVRMVKAPIGWQVDASLAQQVADHKANAAEVSPQARQNDAGAQEQSAISRPGLAVPSVAEPPAESKKEDRGWVPPKNDLAELAPRFERSIETGEVYRVTPVLDPRHPDAGAVAMTVEDDDGKVRQFGKMAWDTMPGQHGPAGNTLSGLGVRAKQVDTAAFSVPERQFDDAVKKDEVQRVDELNDANRFFPSTAAQLPLALAVDTKDMNKQRQLQQQLRALDTEDLAERLGQTAVVWRKFHPVSANSNVNRRAAESAAAGYSALAAVMTERGVQVPSLANPRRVQRTAERNEGMFR